MTKIKFYVYRIWNTTGKKEYKRTKCCDYWTTNKSVCWQYSKQGALKIRETYKSYDTGNIFKWGIEAIK